MHLNILPLLIGLTTAVHYHALPQTTIDTSIPILARDLQSSDPISPLKQTKAADINPAAGECPPVHIITARGSTEALGIGKITPLASLVMTEQPNSTIESVDYPAALYPYSSSSGMGTAATMNVLNTMAGKCPDTKIVLMGYSQGAHVILDAMCGGGATVMADELSKWELAPANLPVPEDVQSKVVAIVQFGDPRKINSVAYNRGTSTDEGIFPRSKDQMCTPGTAAKVISYCDAGDPLCDSGLDILAHFLCINRNYEEAAKFVNDKIAGVATYAA